MTAQTSALAATFRQVLAEHENGALGGIDLAAALAQATARQLSVENLLDTKAGLLLAHNSFEHGMQSMIHSVNASTPGEVWQKPENPYWKAFGPLLTAERALAGGAAQAEPVMIPDRLEVDEAKLAEVVARVYDEGAMDSPADYPLQYTEAVQYGAEVTGAIVEHLRGGGQ